MAGAFLGGLHLLLGSDMASYPCEDFSTRRHGCRKRGGNAAGLGIRGFVDRDVGAGVDDLPDAVGRTAHVKDLFHRAAMAGGLSHIRRKPG